MDRAKKAFDIAKNVFVSFFVIALMLTILRDMTESKTRIFIVGLTGILFFVASGFLGWVYVIKREIPFTDKKSLATGEVAASIGWITIVLSGFLLFLLALGMWLQFFVL